jgi:hypothetical protein
MLFQMTAVLDGLSLKMYTIRSSEASITAYQSTQRNAFVNTAVMYLANSCLYLCLLNEAVINSCSNE